MSSRLEALRIQYQQQRKSEFLASKPLKQLHQFESSIFSINTNPATCMSASALTHPPVTPLSSSAIHLTAATTTMTSKSNQIRMTSPPELAEPLETIFNFTGARIQKQNLFVSKPKKIEKSPFAEMQSDSRRRLAAKPINRLLDLHEKNQLSRKNHLEFSCEKSTQASSQMSATSSSFSLGSQSNIYHNINNFINNNNNNNTNINKSNDNNNSNNNNVNISNMGLNNNNSMENQKKNIEQNSLPDKLKKMQQRNTTKGYVGSIPVILSGNYPRGGILQITSHSFNSPIIFKNNNNNNTSIIPSSNRIQSSKQPKQFVNKSSWQSQNLKISVNLQTSPSLQCESVLSSSNNASLRKEDLLSNSAIHSERGCVLSPASTYQNQQGILGFKKQIFSQSSPKPVNNAVPQRCQSANLKSSNNTSNRKLFAQSPSGISSITSLSTFQGINDNDKASSPSTPSNSTLADPQRRYQTSMSHRSSIGSISAHVFTDRVISQFRQSNSLKRAAMLTEAAVPARMASNGHHHNPPPPEESSPRKLLRNQLLLNSGQFGVFNCMNSQRNPNGHDAVNNSEIAQNNTNTSSLNSRNDTATAAAATTTIFKALSGRRGNHSNSRSIKTTSSQIITSQIPQSPKKKNSFILRKSSQSEHCQPQQQSQPSLSVIPAEHRTRKYATLHEQPSEPDNNNEYGPWNLLSNNPFGSGQLEDTDTMWG